MILEKVTAYIAGKQLLKERDKVIVGLSGGADSVALIDILSRLGYTCVAAHCNFKLRGQESDRDESLVTDFCRNRNIELHRTNFDTYAYAEQNHLSIEMAARELRYNWFDELCTKLDIAHLAIAHHQDDSVETVLLNLIRGTGIRGLTGIPPKNGKIVRPLLCLSRSEILNYITERALLYVTDSTNNETLFTRNKIRLEVIPLLQTINPSVKESIARTSEYLEQVTNIYNRYIEQYKASIIEGNKIKIDELLKATEPQAVLFEILAPYRFNSAAVKQIYNTLEGLPGKKFFSDTHVLLKDRNCLIINEITGNNAGAYYINNEETVINIPIGLKIETLKHTPDFEIEKSRRIIYLDKDKLHFPLEIRRWQQGDWFVPFGMKGRKKLSDYFSDNKFSLFDKENAWILTSGEDIIWLIGHRSDNRYKVTASTRNILKINLLR